MAEIKIFSQKWAEWIENCEGRIKALRSFFEWQSELSDKLVSISWEMTEFTQKTEALENARLNLDPVFTDNFTEQMANGVEANDQKF